MADNDKQNPLEIEAYVKASENFAKKAEDAKLNAELSAASAASSALAATEFSASLAKLNLLIPPRAEDNLEKKGKALNGYLDDYYTFTGKASDINRSLALAGVAIIWIFKNPDITKSLFPKELYYPFIFLVTSLGLDLLQYVLASVFWLSFYKFNFRRWKSGKITDEKAKDLEAPNILSRPIDIIFFLKIASMIIAYILLFMFLQNKLPVVK